LAIVPVFGVLVLLWVSFLSAQAQELSPDLEALSKLWASFLSDRAQEPPTDLGALSKRGFALYQARKYAEATRLAEEYISVAAARFGQESSLYADGLGDLGILYLALNRIDEAEPILKHALVITIASLSCERSRT
jgi:tetratricopeptide (TPR) repeat protein